MIPIMKFNLSDYMKVFVLFFVPILLLLNISACRFHNNKAITKKGNNPFFIRVPHMKFMIMQFFGRNFIHR